jgi:hypothetical protein
VTHIVIHARGICIDSWVKTHKQIFCYKLKFHLKICYSPCTRTYPQTYPCTRADVHTHTHARKHTHTHTHTHIFGFFSLFLFLFFFKRRRGDGGKRRDDHDRCTCFFATTANLVKHQSLDGWELLEFDCDLCWVTIWTEIDPTICSPRFNEHDSMHKNLSMTTLQGCTSFQRHFCL